MVWDKGTLLENDSTVAAGRRLIEESEDEIVISGIGGDFPDAEGLTEFAQKLFNKEDLISDDDRRWKLDHPEIPQRTGKLKQVNKFDASSFGIHYNQAQSMDPMTRILMEKSYEAIIDSGYNPYSLKGSRTGVFIGACFSESEKTWFFEKLQVDGFGVTGCIRTMLANRVSYAFGFDGPSYIVDTACSSSMYALEQGYNSIREGHCDAAIVGGCNLCLHPYVSLQFARLGVLSLDGKCKVFDEAANGYCRSEAIAAVFLQKKKDSRRIYATLVHAKTNCDGYKEQGITYPSGEMQQKLLEEFYLECNIDPASLAWIEAHGTGTKVGDPEEVRALYNVFCKNRKTPLKIGSVKSNLGHTEPSSGMCSIAKVIIAMETGIIPPNINFKTPRSDIEFFKAGEIEVISDPTPWNGGLVGVNSFGFGGANCHALLKWNEKAKKNCGIPEDNIPRLVNVSGRTVEAVETMLEFLEKSVLDAEFVKLLHDIHKDEIPSHLYRGYTILTKNKSFSSREIEHYGMKGPLYIQFSGLCNKWKPFDKSLLQFPIFSQSLTKMSKAVSIDIVELITNPSNIMSNPVDFFVSMVASQIALYDLLQFTGITVDGLIGISIGNLVCAYADGCLGAEDAVHIAYNLALILMDSSVKSGKRGQTIFERDIKGIETKHLSSKLLSFSKPKIMDYLKKILTNGISPSSKWIHTSGDKGDSSAEFIYQNLVSTINIQLDENDFPDDYMFLNVGAKGTYEHLDLSVTEILDNEGNDNMTSFLISLGKLYLGGIDSDISKLYPEVEYPVSRSTPMIAPLVRWNHTHEWFVTSYRLQKKIGSGERNVSVSVKEDETEYIAGHVIDGRNLFPATGYLCLVWETVGLIKGEHYTEIPIVFEDVRYLRATNMPAEGSVDFTVIVQRASGNFEVVEGGAPIVTGRCYVPDDASSEMSHLDDPVVTDRPCTMTSRDIYKELRLRGYNYKGLFRSLMGVNVKENFGTVRWQKNWVAFMDNMLQLQILHTDTRGLFVPTSVDKIVIDGRKHIQCVLSLPEEDDKDVTVYYYKEADLIKCGGIEMRGLRANAISRRKHIVDAVLEKYLFVPNHSESQIYSIDEIMKIYTQIILENENTIHVNGVEMSDNEHSLLAPVIAQVLTELPLIQPKFLVCGNPKISEDEPLPPEVTVEDKVAVTDQAALLVVANNALGSLQNEVLKNCFSAVKPNGYLILRENINTNFANDEMTLLSSHIYDNEKVMLLRKKKIVENVPTEAFYVSQTDFSWLKTSQNAMKAKECKRVVFFGNMDEEQNGVLGFVNCVLKEPESMKARCVFVMDKNMPSFSLENQFYKSQLSKDMAINIYKDGQWGTYRHIKLNTGIKRKYAHVFCNVTTRGDLSSLSWIQGFLSDKRCWQPKGEDIINVYYSSLNFRDVMLASGKLAPEVVVKKRLNQDCVIGFEYSGITSEGTRVMGMVGHSGLASVISYDKCLCWKVPDDWTLEEAATIPCTYGTAIFALITRGKMKKGDSVLIHAGSGGVGQAAIHIALDFGCTVFTTVGTPEKRKFIKDTFPQIDDRHIGNSRDTSFEQLVMYETNGRGVDLVLNSLAEEKLLASVRCLAKGGRFLEIGKFDLSNNNPLGMEIFAKGASFHGILLDAFFDAEPEAKIIIVKLLQKYIDSGIVKPLCSHVFGINDIENAFRFMASGKHIGKVLIKVRDEKEDINAFKLYDGIPRFWCNPDSTYIILGGLGGFGLELADWLVMRGATKLVLTSRKGITTGYQAYRVNIWKSYNLDVRVLTDDITTYEGVENLLKTASSIGPVAGIFNLAVVLKDAIFENQNEESFNTSFGPKALATKYLDQLSRTICPNLEHFVIFSSVSCGRGNAGQTNYGMANSVMERICESRVAEGLPGIAIQWGAVGDVGLLAELMEEQIEMVIGGTLQQRISSCLETMDQFLTQGHPIVSSMVVAEKKAGGSSSDNIVDTVLNILGIRDLKTVSVHSNLAELGMDSMMAVEIKQTLEREFEVFLSPQDIRGMTIAKLQELAAAKDAPAENKEEMIDQMDNKELGEYLITVISPEPERYEPILEMRPISGNDKKKKVFLIPGLEGFPVVFENLVKHMDFNVYGCQFDYTSYIEKISDMTDFFLPKILPYLTEKTFNFVGYSWGGCMTMELAQRLESLGYSGKIILIDSSPEMMSLYCKLLFTEDKTNLQINAILRVFENFNLSKYFDKTEVEDMLKEAQEWDSRVDLATKLGKNVVSMSDKYLKQLLNSCLRRISALHNLQPYPNQFISSSVTLIRPTVPVCQMVEDYELSKHCCRPVTVKFIEGTHLTVLSNKDTADLITEVFNTEDTLSSKTSLLRPPTDIGVISEPTKHI